MDNPIWLTDSVRMLAAALHQFPMLLLLSDVLLKSIVVLTAFWLLDRVIGKQLSSASRHLLWLNALLCLAVLPWLPAVFTLLPGATGAGSGGASVALFELTVLPGQASATAFPYLATGLLCLYLIPVVVMLSKLFVGMHRCRRIRLNAQPIDDSAMLCLLVDLKQKLTITRYVHLRLSDAIESPVSFGIFKPVILLPVQSSEWNESIKTDVLLHELCHIKRLDWLTSVLGYLVVCAYWINPLAKVAVERLRDESEHSCDAAVLNTGRKDTDYAESLLGVATRCVQARRMPHSNHPLMQTMLDQNTLITRISRVLEENKMQASQLKKEFKRSVVLLLVASAGILSVLSATQVFSSQEETAQDGAAQNVAVQDGAARQPAPPPTTRSANGEMLPLHTEEAVYPKAAADEGIEGWVHLRFTVSAEGDVPASSISIVEAEPADIFNTSAVNAAAKFRFRPRVVDGEAVTVENVQYVFRYRLSEEAADDAAAITTPD